MPGNPHDRVALRFDPGLLEIAKEMANISHPLGAGKPGSASTSGFDAAPWQQVVLRDLNLLGGGWAARLDIELGGADMDGVDPRLYAALRVLYAPGQALLRGIPTQAQGARPYPLPTHNYPPPPTRTHPYPDQGEAAFASITLCVRAIAGRLGW